MRRASCHTLRANPINQAERQRQAAVASLTRLQVSASADDYLPEVVSQPAAAI
jgi:hypothetical protein